MVKKDRLQDFSRIKLNIEDKFKEITGESKEFPKYTTQIINLANQNAQGTRPEVVGQMSELIKQCPIKTFEGWKEWYLERHPDAIEKAKVRVSSMIENMRNAMYEIDDEMVRNWVEDLVITKTAEGLIIQEIILKHLAEIQNVDWRLATPDEESRNIDGFLDDTPVSIKPDSYLTKKPTVRENIDVEIIYYKKTAKYLYIYTSGD